MGKVQNSYHHPKYTGLISRRPSIWLWRIAVILLSISSSPIALSVPHCDQALKSIGGVLGYQWRASSSVCEGLYEAKVGGSLEIVSYLIGELNFEPGAEASLDIAVASELTLPSKSVSVRAVALLAGTYYRMDSALVQPEHISWSLNEVVTPAKLDSDMLGVFGWIGSDAEKIFVPLRVTPAEDATATGASTLQLLIRPTVDVDYISWRAWTPDNQAAGTGEIPLGARAGWPFSINIASGPQSVLNIEVSAKEANSDEWVLIRLRVLRSP